MKRLVPLGVHLDIWKQGQTFMNHKSEVSEIIGFFLKSQSIDSLPSWHICMPKFPHCTKQKMVVILFLPHSFPFTFVCCTRAVQYS